MLKHLANIDKSTTELYEIKKDISGIKGDINNIVVKGIKLQ